MLKIFKLIPKFKWIKRPKLIINNSINSDLQITFNYLKLFDEGRIDANNININSTYNQFRALNIQILNLETCEQLLKKYLKIPKPNFYQITSFISILSNQFKLFSMNFYLDASSDINRNLRQIRSFFIKCLINVTKHFISSAYTDILEEQKIANKRQNENYDEDAALEEAKIKLQKKDIVSYDKIDPSLIVFNSDGQSLTFVCTGNESQIEKNQINKFLKIQTNNKILHPPNYKNFKSEEFYEELINLLDLKRKIIPKEGITDINKLKEKYPLYYQEYNNKMWQSMDEIVNSYIFTSDNFIKLILIITRIRTNLPLF